MKPPRFGYVAPTSLDDAVQLLAEREGAQVLAGGQSLLQDLNTRRVHPAVLVDLNRLSDLAYVRPANGGVEIGAMTRITQIERDPLVAERLPLLAEAASWIAYPAVRNRGTLGGNLAYADPLAELPAVMLVLDAEIRARSRAGERSLAARDLFAGPFQTSLARGEVIIAVRIPSPPDRAGMAFLEFPRRRRGYAIAGAAAMVTLDSTGSIAEARVGLCGVGPTALRATAAEDALRGAEPGDDAWSTAAAAVIDALTAPPSDIHGSADYRRHLAGVLTRRALARAAAQAERGT